MKRSFISSSNPAFGAPPARKRLVAALILATSAFAGGRLALADYAHATYSSTIALSADNKLVWSVNPDDDSVAVIDAATRQRIAKIPVGDEPQSVALDPNNRFAYVANAAGGSVSVIAIADARPDYFKASAARALTTGAEPWNIAISPNGKRIFVANSAQDTITVIDGDKQKIIGHVNLRNSVCNDPDRNRHFQPRGLAVTEDNAKLYVTRFFSFVKAGGAQGADTGREGLVCRLDIDTNSKSIRAYQPAAAVRLAPSVSGFKVDATGDGVADDASAFPNQLQSVVIWNGRAYLPNIAASPSGPLRFNVDTFAYVNRIDGANGATQTDAGAINLHLGARDPEAGKKKLFFANAWAIAFTSNSAYAVSAGSDVLVKLNLGADGALSNTVDADTTRYIDLNDPQNPVTSGEFAGKNPRGIVITDDGRTAFVSNFVSRNVSVVDLTNDSVAAVVRTANLPAAGSEEETNLAGAEMFFSSRGHFDRPEGTTASTDERLSSEGWQNCASCHFEGLTDSVVWAFGAGPRKSVSLNGSFNPRDPAHPSNGQRVLNYSAIFDEIEDFELNVRNVSGPGNLAAAQTCSEPPPATSAFNPSQGLLSGDNGSLDAAPCAINAFAKANGGRAELKVVTVAGTSIPALTALRKWVQFNVRTPNGPLGSKQVKGGPSEGKIKQGRALFEQASCGTCHAGDQWTVSVKDFASPPADAAEGFTMTERTGTFTGNPVGTQYLNRFLRDIGSFNLGVAGGDNLFGGNIGAVEKASAGLTLVEGVLTSQAAQDGLGKDYNGDGRGAGFSPPSLLGAYATPPYLHNGACETLACVVSDVNHRTWRGELPDALSDPKKQALVVLFLESISAATPPLPLP
jgi:YVTN family beta-propeller protein